MSLPATSNPPTGPELLPDFVYRRLRRAILVGEHPPGSFLRQEDLATKLGISRIPLREALRRLSAEGLLVLRPRRGYAVVSLVREEIDEIFQLRAIVEDHAGRLAAKHRSTADILKVKSAVAAMERLPVATAAKTSSWLEANERFHEALFACGHGQHVLRIARSLRDLVSSYIRMEVVLTKDVSEAQAEHQRMLDALVTQDARRLGLLCRAHCEHTAIRLLKAL